MWRNGARWRDQGSDPGRGRGQYMGKCGQLVVASLLHPLAANLKWAVGRRRGRHGNVIDEECLKILTNSSVVSWPVPSAVVTHPPDGPGGLRHRAVNLGPGAVQDGRDEVGVLRGGEPGHGVRAAGERGALRVRHRPRVPDVSWWHGLRVSLVGLRVHVHHEAAGLWCRGRPSGMNVVI